MSLIPFLFCKQFICLYVIHFHHSRAHTIVGITLTQKSKNDAGQETAKKSVVNLVDLAGRYVFLLAYD